MREFTGPSKWVGGGGGATWFFFRCKKFSEIPKKNVRASSPKTRTLFGIKMWKISNPASNFFFSKTLQPTKAAEKSLCTKRHFSNGNHTKQKNHKNSPNFQNFQNFAKLIFEKKNNRKKFIFFFSAPAATRHFFFPGACGASFFFFNRKMKSLVKMKKKNRFFFSGGSFEGRDPTWKFLLSWKVMLP